MKNNFLIATMLLISAAFSGNANAQGGFWRTDGNTVPHSYLGTKDNANLVFRVGATANPTYEAGKIVLGNSAYFGQLNSIPDNTNASFAAGFGNTVSGHKSIGLGWNNRVTASNGYALGTHIDINRDYSGAFGVELITNADRAFAIGAGEGAGSELLNDIPRSLMIGFSKESTLFVNNGQVGINTTAPAAGYSLDVNGDVFGAGFWNISDEGFKKEIKTVEGALDKVLALRGTNYHFRTDEFPALKLPEGEQYGFIAQELQKVLPELVQPGIEGHLAVNYIGVIPVLAAAIKEQQAKIEAKDGLIAALQGRADALEARLAKLDAAVANLQPEQPADDRTKKAASFGIAPNPTNGVFRLTLAEAAPVGATALILDFSGREVLRKAIGAGNDQLEFNTTLPNGMYSVAILMNGKIASTQTIVVAK